jgi:hypothetical protein
VAAPMSVCAVIYDVHVDATGTPLKTTGGHSTRTFGPDRNDDNSWDKNGKSFNTRVIDGKVDLSRDGKINADDTGTLFGKSIIKGAVDMNGDGAANKDDEGLFTGTTVIKGLINFNGDAKVNKKDDGELANTSSCQPIMCVANTQTLSSGTDTTIVTGTTETPAVVTFGDTPGQVPMWTHIPGAQWIWNVAKVTFKKTYVELPGETVLFKKTFTLAGAPTSGMFEYAADNAYTITLNGTIVAQDTTYDMQNFATVHSVNLLPYLVSGDNTLRMTVTNQPGWWTGYTPPASAGEENPAGITFKATVASQMCSTQ